jgi:enoyl-CoA hydratase/carnithine racemase
MTVPDFETLAYDEGDDGVAVVTLNRPTVHNAFNSLMQRELHTLWRALRRHDSVHAMGTNQESIGEGQRLFASGKRVEWNLR